MDRDAEFRKRAAAAQRMADRAVSSKDKASWLELAHGWLSLIRKAKRSPEEAFDDDAHAQGTGQDESTGSH